VAERKRPEARPSRLVVEYSGPGEEELVLQLRRSAGTRKEPVREWVLSALRHELERLDRQAWAQPERQVRELPRGAEPARDDDPQGG